MLTRIVRPSPALEAVVASLDLKLSAPQRQHLLQLADALLVCEDTKTLPALQRQFLDSTDPSNWADFLRDTLRRQQLTWLLAEAQRRDLPKVLYLNLDDSLAKKDKKPCHIQPVDWFQDHNESTPGKPRFHKAFGYLECTVRVGHPRPAAVSARQDRATAQPLRLGRAAVALSQQEPSGLRHPEAPPAALA
jgi:hypothetical protein